MMRKKQPEETPPPTPEQAAADLKEFDEVFIPGTMKIIQNNPTRPPTHR